MTTGIKYRLKKRLLANKMLELLCKDMSWYSDPTFSPSDYSTFGFTVGQLKEAFPKYTYDELDGALALLNVNEQISRQIEMEDNPDDPPEYIFPTRQGREAYLEGYYIMANRKDKLEQFEIWTRWILPIAGFTALIWQIIDHLHGKK